MAFRLLNLDGLTDVAVALARALLPTRDWSKRKPPWKFLRSIALFATDVQAQIQDAMLDLLPDTARGIGPGRSIDMLARWGGIKGVAKKGATVARGVDAGRVTGTVAATITAGAVLTHQTTGQTFELADDVTIPAEGFLDVTIVSISTGSAARLSAGEVLTVDDIGSFPGIDESVTLVEDLDQGGEDEEGDGPYRTRQLDRWAQPPLGGAQNDYVQAALEVEGIAAAYCYPNRRGLGTVDVAALHSGTGGDRPLTGGENTALDTALREGPSTVWGGKPVAADLRVLTVVTELVTVELLVAPNGEARWAFDWDDSTPLVVATWNSGTRTLTFTTDRPDSMTAGGRIIIADVAGLGTGQQYEIEALSSTDAVILVEVPDPVPVSPDVVYAGGNLVDPVRDALLEHIDSLGTSNPDAAPYGTWEGSLRPENISTIAQTTAGVRSSEVSVPAATVESNDPDYPDDDEIGLLVPGRVIVRRRW